MRKSRLLYPGETIADYVQSTTTSLERLSTLDPESNSYPKPHAAEALGVTTLRFVFWAHIPENQDYAIELLEGSDVIAYEALCPIAAKTPTQQRRNEAFMDRLDEDDSRLMQPVRGPFKKFREQLHGEVVISRSDRKQAYDPRIIRHFAGRLEGFHRLDVGPREAAEWLAIDNELKIASDKMEGAFSSGVGCSWRNLEDLVIDYAQSFNRSEGFRENTTTRQLTEIIQRYPGRTIGVLYGAAHTNLTRMIDSEGVVLQRFFAHDSGNASSDSGLDFTLFNIVFALRASNDEEYRASDMERYILGRIAKTYATNPAPACEAILSLDVDQVHLYASSLTDIWSEPIYTGESNEHRKIAERLKGTYAVLDSILAQTSSTPQTAV